MSNTTAGNAAVTGLTNGTTYYFRVVAHNAVGNSPSSNIVSAVPRTTAPSAPRRLTATSGNRQVRLAWTSPAANGGAAIDRYIVQRSTTSTGPWTTVSNPIALQYRRHRSDQRHQILLPCRRPQRRRQQPVEQHRVGSAPHHRAVCASWSDRNSR